jgi:hypothetical protein
MYKRKIIHAASALLLIATPVMAQQRDAASHYAAIDSLLPQMIMARRAMLHADSFERAVQLRAASGPLDTAIVQSLTIIAPREQAAETFALFRGAAAHAQELLAGLPRDNRLVLAVEWQVAPHRRLQQLAQANGWRMGAL